jgi:hypothetical protein
MLDFQSESHKTGFFGGGGGRRLHVIQFMFALGARSANNQPYVTIKKSYTFIRPNLSLKYYHNISHGLNGIFRKSKRKLILQPTLADFFSISQEFHLMPFINNIHLWNIYNFIYYFQSFVT